MKAEILQPVALLVAWSIIMWLWMYATRLPAMRRARIDGLTMIGSTGRGLRDDLVAAGETRASWVADNYNHLMEQPTIFYAAALTLALLGVGNGFNASLAWIYVAARVAHSLVQVTTNRVAIRFALHALGTLPLIMLAAHAVFAAFDSNAFGGSHV
jgi:hypothetical protein